MAASAWCSGTQQRPPPHRPPRPGRCPRFFPLPNALLCGSCPMEGEEAVAQLMEIPPNDGDAQERPKEGENGAEGAAEELAATRDMGDSGAPLGRLRPDQDVPRMDHGDSECWG